MNKKPFSYLSRYGTYFSSNTCDFSYGVNVSDKPHEELFISDVAEMIGFHAVNIRPELNGFSGYDCIKFRIDG